MYGEISLWVSITLSILQAQRADQEAHNQGRVCTSACGCSFIWKRLFFQRKSSSSTIVYVVFRSNQTQDMNIDYTQWCLSQDHNDQSRNLTTKEEYIHQLGLPITLSILQTQRLVHEVQFQIRQHKISLLDIHYSLYLLYMNSELQIQDKEKYVKQLGGIHSHSVFAMVALINTVNGLLKHHEVTSKCRLYSHCVYFTV